MNEREESDNSLSCLIGEIENGNNKWLFIYEVTYYSFHHFLMISQEGIVCHHI